MVVWSQDWKKAQSDRLEPARKAEKGRRSDWWARQRAKWEDQQDKKEAEGLTWGSGHWNQRNRSQEKSQGSTGARGSNDSPPPEPTAEPTASSRPLAILDRAYPKRNHGDDMIALRDVGQTPMSFQPQRHITMALGRPVVVLSGI